MDLARHALDRTTRRLLATPAERAAVREYQALEDGSEHLNARLRGGGAPDERDLWQVTHLDALVKRSVVPVDLVTYRGVDDVEEALPVVDDYERRSGYTSTTLDATLARQEFATGPARACCGSRSTGAPTRCGFRRWGGANWPMSRSCCCRGAHSSGTARAGLRTRCSSSTAR